MKMIPRLSVILLIINLLFICNTTHAQSSNYIFKDLSFKKGNLIFSFGLGTDDYNVASDFGNLLGLQNEKKKSLSIPNFYKLDYALRDRLSLGIHLSRSSFVEEGYDSYSADRSKLFSYTHNNMTVNLRLNFNFPFDEHFAFYYGLGLGVRFDKTVYKHFLNNQYIEEEVELEDFNNFEIPIPSRLGFEATFGMRYFPVKNLGFYWEFGINKSFFQGGLALKI